MLPEPTPAFLVETRAKVNVRIPATTGNLGPGFDIMGMALELENEAIVWVRGHENGRVHLSVSGEGAKELSDPSRNVMARALYEILQSRGLGGLEIEIFQSNKIPLRRGLGSSATAALAGVLVGLELSAWAGDRRLPTTESILAQAVPFEGHPDNIVPALVGGICLCWQDGAGLKHVRFDPPPDLLAVVCIPDVEMATSRARDVLPVQVPMKDAIFNASRVALLMTALLKGRGDLLGPATEDRLHQPYRIPLIPEMGHAIEAAKAAGAFGGCLSGSGSTVLAWLPADDRGRADEVGRAMVAEFERASTSARYLVLRPSATGAFVKRVVDQGGSG